MICQLNPNRIHDTHNEKPLQTAKFGFLGFFNVRNFVINLYNWIENAPENAACIHVRNSVITQFFGIFLSNIQKIKTKAI